MALETVSSRRQRGNPTKWVWGSVGPSRSASRIRVSRERAPPPRGRGIGRSIPPIAGRTPRSAGPWKSGPSRGRRRSRRCRARWRGRARRSGRGSRARGRRPPRRSRPTGRRVRGTRREQRCGQGRGREGATDVVDAEAVLVAVGLGSGRQRGGTRGVATLPRARDRLREGEGEASRVSGAGAVSPSRVRYCSY